jgi:hypothetical protein
MRSTCDTNVSLRHALSQLETADTFDRGVGLKTGKKTSQTSQSMSVENATSAVCLIEAGYEGTAN